MERPDKHGNRAFYDTEREQDRLRFEVHASKLFQAELVVPRVVNAVPPGARIIDIGGGSGTYASEIVRAAPLTVVGLDISASMIEQRARDPLLPENVVGDMEALPFDDASFDAALFVGSLHHVPDPLPALREAHRVVRPGGLLLTVEPCSLRVRKPGVERVPGYAHEFRFSLPHLKRLITESGFAVNEVTATRVALRLVSYVVRDPSLATFRRADRLDRLLAAVPGYTRLAAVALIQARRT